jgi:hypothetical protein
MRTHLFWLIAALSFVVAAAAGCDKTCEGTTRTDLTVTATYQPSDGAGPAWSNIRRPPRRGLRRPDVG